MVDQDEPDHKTMTMDLDMRTGLMDMGIGAGVMKVIEVMDIIGVIVLVGDTELEAIGGEDTMIDTDISALCTDNKTNNEFASFNHFNIVFI